VGGWSINGVVTLQSGQPLSIFNDAGLLVDGNQRPNVVCCQLSTGLSYHDAAKTGGAGVHQDWFGDPGDNIPGTAPRDSGDVRGEGIRHPRPSLTTEST